MMVSCARFSGSAACSKLSRSACATCSEEGPLHGSGSSRLRSSALPSSVKREMLQLWSIMRSDGDTLTSVVWEKLCAGDDS